MADYQWNPRQDDDRLRGWKEIGLFLRACDRTVQRWERSLHLPVHRIDTARNAGVFASRRELESWLQSAEGRAALSERDGTHSRHQVDASAAEPESPAGLPLAEEPEPASLHLSTQGAQHAQTGCGRDTGGEAKESAGPDTLSTRRSFWPILGVVPALAAIAVALLVAPISDAQKGGRATTPLPVAPDRSAPDAAPNGLPLPRSAGIRLAFEDGASATVWVSYGGVATSSAPGGTIYAFSAERIADGARIHASRFEPLNKQLIPQLSEVGAWSLRHGEAVTVSELPGIASIQLAPPRHANPGRAVANNPTR